MRLFGSEMTRLASRRLFRWVLVLFMALLVLAGVLVFVNDNGSYSRDSVAGGLLGLSIPLLMFGWLVGASAIGAEWGNRTVSALLTWEPRRTRVLLAKVVAASFSTALWVLALEIVWTAVMMAVASGADPAFERPFSWVEYGEIAARILAVSVLASILGFAVATIGKNTGAALGAGMAYLLIVETLVRTYKSEWNDWLLSTNFVLVIEGRLETFLERSTGEAALLLAAYSAGLFLVALWFFRRREMA